MHIKVVLRQLGLNERHAAIYLACLELGSASVQKISEKSGLARSTCEFALKSLVEKGFVTSFKKKNVKNFSPEDPKKLVSLAKERVKLLEEALPQFTVRYFKGGSLPMVRLDSIDDIYAVLGHFFPKFTAERVKRKIRLRTILRRSVLAEKRQETGAQELREVRIISEEYDVTSVTFIWNNKVAMCSLRDGVVAFVIESKELATIQKTMFELIWNTLGGTKLSVENNG